MSAAIVTGTLFFLTVKGVRDWSLNTGRGLQNGTRWTIASEVLPLKKKGVENVLAMLKGTQQVVGEF